jgi:hypothetical protein
MALQRSQSGQADVTLRQRGKRRFGRRKNFSKVVCLVSVGDREQLVRHFEAEPSRSLRLITSATGLSKRTCQFVKCKALPGMLATIERTALDYLVEPLT